MEKVNRKIVVEQYKTGKWVFVGVNIQIEMQNQ
jgi:hypothetical protein